MGLIRFVSLFALVIAVISSGAGSIEARSLWIQFLPPANEDEETVLSLIRDSQHVSALVSELDEILMLPQPVTVTFGAPLGPEYDPLNRQISFPYRFIVRLIASLGEFRGSRELKALDAVEFVLLHELGHALIDQLGISFPGYDERPVDALATVFAIELLEGGEEIVLAAADLFTLEKQSGEETSGTGANHWRVFKMDQSRYQTISCWVLGSDPQRFSWLETGEGVGRISSDSCSREYSEIKEAWLPVLEPIVRF